MLKIIVKKIATVAAVVTMSVFSVSSFASIVTDGTLYRVGTGSSVDHWGFSTTGGTTTIDTLSMEWDFSGPIVDVNGDGEIAFFDPYIHLFADDGSLDSGDLIASNDDSNSTFSDGSIFRYDSFLSLNLGAGDYILAIGAYHMSVAEAISQINDPNSYPVTCAEGVGSTSCSFETHDHGDYQITWSDNVTITSDPGTGTGVPAPAPIALFGLALVMLGLRRRHAIA